MRTRIVFVVLIGLLALPIVKSASPVEAKKRSRTVTRTFSNPTAVNTNAGLNFPSPVSAVVYPSPITVRGLKGRIRDVDLTLAEIYHSRSGDLEVLLVGPGGQTAIVMAEVGGDDEADGVTLRLDDEVGAPLPVAALQSGAFRPTNAESTAIAFNAPAPEASANAALSVFDGTDPNGTWRLFVQDDYGPTYSGVFAGGWELEITTKVKAKKKR